MEGHEKETRQICTQCEDNNIALCFCSDCKEHFCSECVSAHRRTKLTKGHELQNIGHNQQASGKQDTAANETRILCQIHVDKEVTLICLDCSRNLCELCANEEHSKHVVKGMEELYREKHAHLMELVNQIKQYDFQTLTKRLEEIDKEQRDKNRRLKAIITADQFKTYRELLDKRRDFLNNEIEQATEEMVKRLEMNKHSVGQCEGLVSEADALLKETDPLTFLKSNNCLTEKLTKFQQKVSTLSEITELRYNQACTTEDFSKLIQALGSIQEFKGEIGEDGNNEQESNTELHSVSPVSNESAQSGKLMEVLKSFSVSQGEDRSPSQMSYRSSKLDSTETEPGINNETFTLHDVNKTHQEDIPNPVSLVERNISWGRRKMLSSGLVQNIVRLRFQTWDLKGEWNVEGDSLKLFSRSADENEQCLEILKETVLEKSLELRKGSEFIVESDKWQIVTGQLKRKYPDQIEIEINHNDGKVYLYSTCTTILNDSFDIIRIFLRDNQVKTVTLQYDEHIVKYVMRNKKKLQKIRNCTSQYCVEISNPDKNSILLKGIGFGLGEAIRMVHEIASKHSTAEEDRFDSDHEDDDDAPRFSDDDQEKAETNKQEKSDVSVQMNLNVDGENKSSAIQTLCFPGDDRMIYVVAGDITELPAEALVNAADKTLKHNGGLAKALVQKGGRSIQEECTDHIQRNGHMQEGQVYCSAAGKLPFSAIVHAVGPKWIDGKSKEEDKLYECITNCLMNASRKRIASIAFPAVSSGTYKFPVKNATFMIVKGVKNYVKEQPRCSIREIYLCDKASDTVGEFANAVKEAFRDCDIVSSNNLRALQTAEHAQIESSVVRNLLFI